jgi:A/G-specific adenine glycosylase
MDVKVDTVGSFSEDLLEWWLKNARHFPWREVRDPYRILIAEILLHRTRAENVVPIYLDFISKFPDIRTLVNADQDDVLRVIAPLGLRWRSMLLREAIGQIFEKYGGEIPLDRRELLSLPGIGDYVASAVTVIAGGQDGELLDTNTVRVICRVTGDRWDDSMRRKGEIREKYSALRGDAGSVEFAYSLIDLAALVCLPRDPKCGICPVSVHCITRTSESSSNLNQIPHLKKYL